MTEAEIKRVALAFPDVNVRHLTHIVEGAAAEAAAGLTSTRVIAGWRVVTDRRPPGDWLITAVPVGSPPYPAAPPNDVIVVVMSIATEAGVAHDQIVNNTMFDPDTGELRLAWVAAALQECA